MWGWVGLFALWLASSILRYALHVLCHPRLGHDRYASCDPDEREYRRYEQWLQEQSKLSAK